MDTAMTTFARGISAPMRAVGAFIGIERSMIGQRSIVEGMSEVRSAVTAGRAERQAIQRDQAWIEAAAVAAMRMHPRG